MALDRTALGSRPDADSGARVYRLVDAMPGATRLPYSLRILLEGALRAGLNDDVEAIAGWVPGATPATEVHFHPSRALLHDTTGVPALVDLAAVRDAVAQAGRDPRRVAPTIPAVLVVDHSLQVDVFARPDAMARNVEREFERNGERYTFLRWAQQTMDQFEVVPPNSGIMHQVNLELLAEVVSVRAGVAFPDSLIGSDSHTTMVNGLGVLGWGVGGIEVVAGMLGEPLPMLLPRVVGVRLSGRRPDGTTSTDVVLRVTELLRDVGVVGAFVEFTGPSLETLSVADRATIANMAPEYGATCGFFPVDARTIEYLRLTGRTSEHADRVEAYCKCNLLWHDPATEPCYSQVVDLDLGTIEPSIAGPHHPEQRLALGEASTQFVETFHPRTRDRSRLRDGSIVIAAITSCTNTSNPASMIAAGLVARKAVERGLRPPPWVKTSLAPGSRAVTEYLERAGLSAPLDALGFQTVGYACTTCIGASGPLPIEVAAAIDDEQILACAVLSGNRNFEARIHSAVHANYLMSPALVVAYALAGAIDIDLTREPLGTGTDGSAVYLRDLWPGPAEIDALVSSSSGHELFARAYRDIFVGDARWRSLRAPGSAQFPWAPGSAYLRRPPFLDDVTGDMPLQEIVGARCLVALGDGVTTDHISPAGAIGEHTPAGRYLAGLGVERQDFNTYASRRGNFEVMTRATFANVRLRNALTPQRIGGWTAHLPSGDQLSIFDAAERYRSEGVPLIVIAGAAYGTGSSRDWAAKGLRLLGVKAVLAESYERIHRSNLLMMGVLPLEFEAGTTRTTLGLTGRETFAITEIEGGDSLTVRVEADEVIFRARIRLDTPRERDYFRAGGILPFLVRKLTAA